MNRIIFHLDDSKNLRGGERQVLYLARESLSLGEKNYIVARNDSPLLDKARLLNIPNFTLPYLFEWDPISAILLALKARKICGKNSLPIFHSHTGHTPAISFLASLIMKSARIAHRRVDFPLKKNILSRLKYSTCDAIIAISLAIKKILLASGLDEKQIKVINSSFSIRENTSQQSKRKEMEKAFNLTEKTLIAGSLIALQPHKDPLNLIRAAALCLKKDKNIFFLLGGEGPLRSACEQEIYRLGVGESFKMLGEVKENIAFLKAIDIFILPSREEGLGSVLLEAMACAVPIAATNAGGIPELVVPGLNGLLAEKENPEALANIILQISSDRILREKFSSGSLKKVEEFSPKEMAAKTIKVYDEILENFKHN
ncbi:MAG: glycosyltransferase [Elusimicrobiota bacterium]